MESAESMLYVAALEGNTTTLQGLLEQDRLILDRVTFMNHLSHKTPLHVAACLGHADFVKEILRRKPELAGEFDSRQSSPLHVASMKGDAEIVRALLEANPDMCLARDVDGRNPLHMAAMKGRIDVLKELVRVRALAASATTLTGETILHLCVKHQQLETLKFLLENKDFHQLLSAKDDYGMTILHLAVAGKQIEAVDLILATSTKIEVNALNANGFTALDILALSVRDVTYWKINRLLRRAKAVIGTSLSIQKKDDWLENMRSAILVVASLIATVAFQAAAAPPGGTKEDKNTAPSPPPETDWIGEFYYNYLKESFILFNTVAFLASISTILMLISGLPLNRKVALWVLIVVMWAAVTAMTFTYVTCLGFIQDLPYVDYSPASNYVSLVWFCVASLLLLSHIVRVIIKIIKYIREVFVQRPRERSLWPSTSRMKNCLPKLRRRSLV